LLYKWQYDSGFLGIFPGLEKTNCTGMPKAATGNYTAPQILEPQANISFSEAVMPIALKGTKIRTKPTSIEGDIWRCFFLLMLNELKQYKFMP
jgi:hypothetical protein